MENLKEIAAEVNKTWTSNYKAEVKDQVVVVSYEMYTEQNEIYWKECAYVKKKGSGYFAFGEDEDAVKQLEYMITR